MNARAILAVVGAFVILLFTSSARAYSGNVSACYSTWNANGNYCDPSLQDCTGTRYPKSLFATFQPFVNAHVEIWQGAAVIGQGSTDGYGCFNVAWTASSLANAYVRWFTEQKDGRFSVLNLSGQLMNNNSATFTLTNGTTAGGPQALGYFTSGSSGGVQWYTNVYWAAELEWRTAFSNVGSLLANYTGVAIYGYGTTSGPLASCASLGSCAWPPAKQIQLDTAQSCLAPQSRTMHESGHVANYEAKPWVICSGSLCAENYAWPYFTSGGGWGATSAEWASASFEEAFATFSADNTLWSPNAATPTSCFSLTTCPVTGYTNIEQTNYPHATNNCDLTSTNPEARWPLSTERFIWDIYDAVNDCDGDTIQQGYDCYWCMYGNLTGYPDGTGFHQIDEAWNASYTAIDTYDSRGANSYSDNFNHSFAISPSLLLTDNCSPP